MVQVLNRGETIAVRLACTICGEWCRLNELWLAFPPGEAVRGEWVHRTCLDGRFEATLGSRRAVLMRGIDALQRVAESLQDDAEPRLRPRQPSGRR